MDPTRILPDLQCSLLCEEVRREMNGNFMAIGILGAIPVPQLPVTALQLCVFNRWTAGIGAFQECVRLIAPDQQTVLRQAQGKFTLQQAVQTWTNVSVFGQITFDKPGVYFIEVLIDDVMKIRYPLPVVLVKQPQGAGQPGQPPQAPPTQNPPDEAPPPATPPAGA